MSEFFKKHGQKVVTAIICVCIIVIVIYLFALNLVIIYNREEILGDNYNTYTFIGNVVIEKQDYITVEVIDSGTANLKQGDFVEVSRLLAKSGVGIKDVLFFNLTDDCRSGSFSYTVMENGEKVGKYFSYGGTLENSPNINKGDCLEFVLGNDVQDNSNFRLVPLSITKLDNIKTE